MLLGVAEALEEQRVLLGRADGASGVRVTAEGVAKGRLARHLGGDHVGGVIEVGRHLHRELPAGAERRRQAREERRVIIDPVQRGVREDDVPGRARREGADVARLEAEPALRARPRLGEHRLGAVDAERLARRELVVETRGQLARTAPEIHHPHARARADERQQVEERPRALVVEAPVLCGIPEVARHAGRISYPPPRSSTNAAGDAIERGACHLARGMPPVYRRH